MVNSFVKSRFGLASAHVVFPLPKVPDPDRIGITEWHRKPADDRAPSRSVAAVDVTGQRFIALVVDTVRGRALWLITGHTNRLALLYDGMQLHQRERHTLVLSARLHYKFQEPHVAGHQQAQVSFQAESEDHCESVALASEVHGGDPGGGSPGVVVTASVVQDVVTAFGDADATRLGDNDAIDVR